ncbi:MAG: NUDIX hydrolase [Reyranella sp.]|uniref:NUDIX hydrolase n=1 Tax=Reyranella sp. TaxID=1929291 RepID=UPI001AC7AAFD|nr:NUDIX hydrolase [Reyranella sp.]MBN9088543.1 NUDIX hydrolase [Reyranella sp.]
MAKHIEPWRLLDSIYSFSDRWLRLRSDTVRLPSGSTLTPYHVIEAADWVNVVAISDTGCIILVEQYRHAVTRTMMEIPAGHIDPREAPEAAARRELQEETGYGGGTWHGLGVLHPAASRFNNQVHSFLALGVTKVAQPAPEESENLHLHEIPWLEFVDGLRAGRLKLPEANQMSSLLLVHLLATTSSDPDVQRLRL